MSYSVMAFSTIQSRSNLNIDIKCKKIIKKPYYFSSKIKNTDKSMVFLHEK